LGVVGFGRIGRAVATRARGLEMRLLVADRSASPDEVAGLGAELVAMDDLFAMSDAVSLHVPLTGETRHLVGADRLARMKPDGLLVNCARGQIVDLAALVNALQEGRIAGAGLDVVEPDRLPLNHPLLAFDNVIVTPHVAFYSEESIAELQRQATQNVLDVLAGRVPAHVVNGTMVARS
jgi:D-3-phosphoglycerate dehydrogenase / 2-oxoglutarate reductase